MKRLLIVVLLTGISASFADECGRCGRPSLVRMASEDVLYGVESVVTEAMRLIPLGNPCCCDQNCQAGSLGAAVHDAVRGTETVLEGAVNLIP